MADDYCVGAGAEVVAVARGTVAYASAYKSCPNWGHLILVNHTLAGGREICSLYGHVPPDAGVIVGASVSMGQRLGAVGSYGCWTDHLHMGIYDGPCSEIPCGDGWCYAHGYLAESAFPGGYLDPLEFLASCPALDGGSPLPPVDAGPCAGLMDGDYCGSSPSLNGYAGSATDLVTCTSGQVTLIESCPTTCMTMPYGVPDECVEPSPLCGNGWVDPGEQCDGAPSATCASLGFDGGSLGCNASSCTHETAGCCHDACAVGARACEGSSVVTCGYYGSACTSFGGATPCAQACQDGVCTSTVPPCPNGELAIAANAYPSFTPAAAGCALDNGMTLRLSVALLSTSVARFYVQKADGSVWTSPATLTLYVGSGPTCGIPPNVTKATAPVVVGATTQQIELVVDPYAGGWAVGEEKTFWVGKSESGYPAARATGTIRISRICDAP